MAIFIIERQCSAIRLIFKLTVLRHVGIYNRLHYQDNTEESRGVNQVNSKSKQSIFSDFPKYIIIEPDYEIETEVKSEATAQTSRDSNDKSNNAGICCTRSRKLGGQ